MTQTMFSLGKEDRKNARPSVCLFVCFFLSARCCVFSDQSSPKWLFVRKKGNVQIADHFVAHYRLVIE